MRRFSWLVSVVIAALIPARDVRACGGLVQPASGTVGQSAQRAFYALRSGSTELVLQVIVPESSNAWGVVVPVGARPTLHEEAIPSDELDALETSTAPVINVDEKSSGPSCGCGTALAGDGARNGINVTDSVGVGPVTVTALQADDGNALNAWLSENGYAVGDDGMSLVGQYAGPGQHFLAIKRNGTASTDRSVGVHVTLPGDQRGFAVRMARLGSAEDLGFTIFVAAPTGVSPTPPYAGLTLRDLDEDLLRNGDYRGAVKQAVAQRFGRAFVVEGVHDVDVLGERLKALVEPSAKITRLSSVIARDEMTADVVFNSAPLDDAPGSITISGSIDSAGGGSGPGPFLVVIVLLGLAMRMMRVRRVAWSPA